MKRKIILEQYGGGCGQSGTLGAVEQKAERCRKAERGPVGYISEVLLAAMACRRSKTSSKTPDLLQHPRRLTLRYSASSV